MALPLRLMAVGVGLINALACSVVADTVVGEPQTFSWAMEPWPLTMLYAFFAIMAGLLVSEILLRLMRSSLSGGFFARYLTLILAVSLGGTLMGASLTLLTLSDVSMQFEDRLYTVLIFFPLVAVVGCVIGLTEGVILAFPLAVILGRFRPAD